MASLKKKISFFKISYNGVRKKGSQIYFELKWKISFFLFCSTKLENCVAKSRSLADEDFRTTKISYIGDLEKK